MTTDQEVTWVEGGLEFKVKIRRVRGWGSFDTDQPRDSHGRWIDTGAIVDIARIVGGGRAKVINPRPKDTEGRSIPRMAHVRPLGEDGKPNGQPDRLIARRNLTVVSSGKAEAGKTPKPSWGKRGDAARARREGDAAALPPASDPNAPNAPGDGPDGLSGPVNPKTGKTKAQEVAERRKYKLPTDTPIAELQKQLAETSPKPVKSVVEHIDEGKSPDEAAAAYKKDLHASKTAAWRQRTILQAAIDTRILADKKQGPSKADEVIEKASADPKAKDSPAELDKLLDQFKEKPKALYDAPKGKDAGKGPGAVGHRKWFDHLIGSGQTDNDDAVPVAGLTIQGRKVEQGWAKVKGGRAWLVEQKADETPEQAMTRLDAFIDRNEQVVAGLPPGNTQLLSGGALMAGPNPHDAMWAKKYNTPGFKSAATGGDGSVTAWNGENPQPYTIAHELGHNLDAQAHLASKWLSDAEHEAVLPGQKWGWKAAGRLDQDTSAGWAGRYKETRPGGHPVKLGEAAVSSYGANSNREDFAESVRLYLKDRREQKIGYDPTTGDNVRFSDVFPERAKILDLAFGVTDSKHDETPARKRRMAEALSATFAELDGLSQDELKKRLAEDKDFGLGQVVPDMKKHGLPFDTVLDIRRDAVKARVADLEAKKKAEEALAAKKAAEAAELAKKYETIKDLVDGGLLDKSIGDKFRARARAAKFAAKKKGASDEEASKIGAAYERALVAKWLEENPVKGLKAVGGGKPAPWPGEGKEFDPKWKTASNTAGDDWLKAAGSVKHPKAKYAGMGQAQQAKSNIAAELASRLNNEADWEIARHHIQSIPKGNGVSEPTLKPFNETTAAERQGILDTAVAARVSQWAGTSGDSNPAAVHMQIAVGEEFGLDAHAAPRMEKDAWEQLKASYTPSVAAFYRRVARVMYEHTQDELEKAGITEISLYRGMKFYGERPSWTYAGKHRPKLQPANSWSTKRKTAKIFGPTIFKTTIPRERILGTSRTGFGCLHEQEFVVLDSDGLADVTGDAPELSAATLASMFEKEQAAEALEKAKKAQLGLAASPAPAVTPGDAWTAAPGAAAPVGAVAGA